MATSDVVAVLAGAELDDNHDQEACPRCGRPADEICFSDAAGERCCLTCHCRASDAARPAGERAKTRAAIRRHQAAKRRVKPRKAVEETAYAQLVRKVCDRLEALTGMRPSPGLDGTGTVGAYCPTGCGGLLVVRFIDGRPPQARVNAGFPDFTPDVCSRGCPAEEIFEAMR